MHDFFFFFFKNGLLNAKKGIIYLKKIYQDEADFKSLSMIRRQLETILNTHIPAAFEKLENEIKFSTAELEKKVKDCQLSMQIEEENLFRQIKQARLGGQSGVKNNF